MDSGEITRLLREVRSHTDGAIERLADAVSLELHRIAVGRKHLERADFTLSPTEIVSEAWIRLARDIANQEIQDRQHFYGIVSSTMRRVVVDYARKRKADKRGKGLRPIPLDSLKGFDAPKRDEGRTATLEVLVECVNRLREIKPRAACVTELRFFAGMSISEVADLLGIETRTVDRDWKFARTWLYGEMRRLVGSVPP